MSSAPPDTETGTGSAGQAFADARGCKDWLGALPITNSVQAQATLLDGLRKMNAGPMAGMERLKCLELMRDKVAYLQGERRAAYFGKAVPLPPNETSAWLTGRGLLDEMEAGYRKAFEMAAGDGELARHRALVAQRAVRYVGAQLLYHALIYRRFDDARWARLHETYRLAAQAGQHEERIKDSLESDDSTSSVAEAYGQVLLLGSAGLGELSAGEVEFAAALAKLWARKVKVLPPGAEAASLASMLDTTQLSLSLRKRIHALKNDQPVDSLGLPAAGADVDVMAMLQHLLKRWCEGAVADAAGRKAEAKMGLVFGANEIHFFLSGGKPFEQPDKKRELSPREKQDIEVFGRVTERTAAMMVSEHNFTVERWDAIEEMLGAWRLLRPANSTRGLKVGMLLAMRAGDAAPFFLGAVSALAQEPDGRLVATVTLFPGKPETIPVRAADARNRANAKWSQGFKLPEMEKLKVPATLVLPVGMARRGRGVEVWEGEPKEKTVYEVVKHGSDFDRVTVF